MNPRKKAQTLPSNGTPNTCSATRRISLAVSALCRAEPSVAEVATGHIVPSGRSALPPAATAANRRSSIATSVPCAPS